MTETRVLPRENFHDLVATSEFREKVREVSRRLEEDGVDGVYFQLSSVDGRILAKLVMREQFESVALAGIRLHYGALCDARTDSWGDLIGFRNEEIEGIGIPDPDTYTTLPWQPRLARVWCNFYNESTGELLDHDVRGNLKRIEERLEKETGLRLFTGIEPEMMWLRRKSTGELEHSTASGAMYHVAQFHELEDLFLDVVDYSRGMGLKLSHADHEDASQIEFNQQPATALTFADDFVTFRQICRVVAKKHGMVACFMPKPFMGVSGNGHHHHVSLIDSVGQNQILGELAGDCRLSETGFHFAGGLLKHADALTLLGAPSVNSYKRFWDIGFWAPFVKGYGYNNRTLTLRVPAPGRFEIRQFDSSCNPYLTLAGVAMAALDGLKNGIDPGAPFEGDGSMDIRIPREQRIPLSLGEGIDAFEADPLMKETFRPGLYNAFLALRRDELVRYSGQVSQWETNFYMERYP
jgi:glutamine synthetase